MLLVFVRLVVAVASDGVIVLLPNNYSAFLGLAYLDVVCQNELGPLFIAFVCASDRSWVSMAGAELFTKTTRSIGIFPSLSDRITDRNGNIPPDNVVLTGCDQSGEVGANCNDFTSFSETIETGDSGNLTGWLTAGSSSCGVSGYIYCIARDQLPAIWVSAGKISAPLSGIDGLNEMCRAEDDGLPRTYALVCQDSIDWPAVLQGQPTVTHKYNNASVGPNAFTTFELVAPISFANGSDSNGAILTGCDGGFGYQDTVTTCDDWNNSLGMAFYVYGTSLSPWFSGGTVMSCGLDSPIFCVRLFATIVPTTPAPTSAPTTPVPTATLAPTTLAPTTSVPTFLQNSTIVLASSNLTATVVLPPEVLRNGTVIANIIPGTNTTISNSIISIVLQDPFGNSANVTNLSTPVSITFALKLPINPDAVNQCLGFGFVVEPVLPTCSYLNENTTEWETDGCKVATFNATHVQCNCTHFTLFAVTAPKYNKLVPSVFLDLTPSNLAANPTGLVTVVLILVIFAIMFVVAGVTDRKEAAQYEQLKSAKHEKWKKFEADKAKATLWKQVKIAFQKRHTWFSLAFRKSGTSFRSVDRTFVALLSAFASMSMSAFYHAQDNNNVARVGVIVISVLVCAIPSQLLTLLFVRTGPVGFYEEWEQSRKAPPKNKCLAYRFPEKWRHVWRVSTLIVVIAMIVYVLGMSVNFDRQPFYFCQGEAAVAWVGTWLLAYMASVLLIEPLRIVLLTLAAHFTHSLRTDVATRMTEMGSVEPANKQDLHEEEEAQESEGEEGQEKELGEEQEANETK